MALFGALLWAPGPAAVYTAGSAANPTITDTINVQIIDVCGVGSASKTCASTAPVAAYETFANAIYAQAGIGFSFAKTIEKINVAGSSGCGGGAASTFCSDTTSGSVFDTVHTLIDLPGDGQSLVANTLNVYLVKSLVQTGCVPGPLCSPVYGWGLVGGNGSVIATERTR